MDGTAAVRALERTLEKDDRFAAAVLFGSAARDALRPDSDIDIAWLASHERGRCAIDRDLLSLLASLSVVARRDVQLIDLAGASLALRRVVFDSGRVLFDRTDGALRKLHRATAVEYVDNEYLRRIVDRSLNRRLESFDGPS